MNRNIFLAATIAALLCVGCGPRAAAPVNSRADGEGHNHAAHEGHDHTGHESHTDHDGHDHSGHEAHANHDHSSQEAHDHSSSGGHEGHDHGTSAAGPRQPLGASSDEIVFTPEQAARTDFEVQTVVRGAFREVIECYGTVEAARGGITTVTAPVAGVVTIAGGRVIAGAAVGGGQELFTLSSVGLASGDAVAKARIAYDLARTEFERVAGLHKEKLATNREYAAAEAEYLRARAEYEPLSRSGASGGMAVVSPKEGYLTEVMVSSGDYVEMGQPLATIAGTGRMELRALVSQRYFDRLSGIGDANFTVPTSGATYSISRLGGELYSAGRRVEAGSSLIPVVFGFDGGKAFASAGASIPDGAFVEVKLLGLPREGVVALPLTAITEQQGLHYVYVQLDEECYSRREVRLGADDGLRVEILSGVEPGDRVVTRGAVNVKMASASSSIPHGHTH